MAVSDDDPPGRVLVAGTSGVVGFAAAHRFATSGWDVLGLSRRRPDRLPGAVEFLSVDLAEPKSVDAARAHFAGVTHLVYAALFEKPGLFAGWLERDQMERNLAMLANLYRPLAEEGALRHVSLLQGTKAYGAHVGPMAVPGRERNPRHQHPNFYWLQEDYLRERQAEAGRPWARTIQRPPGVY
jgi:nucleoside-diphosphate-sugar epimerase